MLKEILRTSGIILLLEPYMANASNPNRVNIVPRAEDDNYGE